MVDFVINQSRVIVYLQKGMKRPFSRKRTAPQEARAAIRWAKTYPIFQNNLVNVIFLKSVDYLHKRQVFRAEIKAQLCLKQLRKGKNAHFHCLKHNQNSSLCATRYVPDLQDNPNVQSRLRVLELAVTCLESQSTFIEGVSLIPDLFES